ncbi:MAG: hypothetical protein JW881_15290 [Spirochaetales bacterium]|nr:hypothetical protein [Spirochaetales bacterium]
MEDIKIPDHVEKIFKEEPFILHLYPGTKTKTFKSFRSFYRFLQNELGFWMKYRGGRINKIKNNFQARIHDLENIVNTENREHILQIIKNKIFEMNNENPEPAYVYSETEFGSFIIEVCESRTNIDFIWEYLFQKQKQFDSKFNQQPSAGFMHYAIRGFQILNNEAVTHTDNTTREYELIIKENENNRDILSNAIVDIRNKKEEIIGEFSTKSKNLLANEEKRFNEQYKTEKDNFKELTKQYQEKLRIDGPASYWEKFKTRYRWGGVIWIGLSVCMVIAIIFISFHLLENLPDQLFTGTNITNSNTTLSEEQVSKSISIENIIRWTILLALIFSALIFLLRLFVKLALSAFHLSRDANERLQLTHQYLALLKEGVLEEKHREIILQSLFSRAETGLLKGDSSPSFPSGILNQILDSIGGKH